MVQKNRLLGNKATLRIIEFFAEDAARKAYVEEIRKSTGMAKATITKWLKRLQEAGVLRCEHAAHAKYYWLDTGNPLGKQLLLTLLLEELVPAFKDFDGEVYLYGSLARGEPAKQSDIDLLVITKDGKKEAYREVGRIEKSLKRKLSPTIVSPLELAAMARHSKEFYKNVSQDRIRIRG